MWGKGRVRQGPEREVYFDQERKPGEQGQSDFTDMRRLGVTIRGEPYPHLLYRFVLPYSNWEHVELAVSETFEALAGGLQESLWELGGV
ncbi:MAG: IS21 family transposase, partial [Chloroflexi bacterium]|nr:IS21 family transposase [Chloroflexota bacterium]